MIRKPEQTRLARTIVFEGGEAAGKTSQLRRLAATLRDTGQSVLTTGVFLTAHGKTIRKWLMDEQQIGNASLRTQLFVLGSAMNQLLDEVAAATEDVVLIDRFIYTTMAYHGGGLEMGIEPVQEIYAPITAQFTPDLILYLDLPPEQIAMRKPPRDRVETKPLDFHTRVRTAYHAIAAALPNARTIDAQSDEVTVHQHILDIVRELVS